MALATVLLLASAPQPAHVIPAPNTSSLGRDRREPDRGRTGAPTAGMPASATAAPPTPVADTPAPVVPHRLAGEASWGDFGGHVVTRLARGTRIRVCGALGCWPSVTTWGRSWGYGPAKRTGRIVDLDRSVFAAICGDPRRGVCQVVLRWQ